MTKECAEDDKVLVKPAIGDIVMNFSMGGNLNNGNLEKKIVTRIEMFMKFFFALLILFIIESWSSSIGQSLPDSKSTKLSLYSNQSMNLSNPLDVTGAASDLFMIVGEPLFLLDSIDDRLKPWLAESYAPSANGREWQITLREGITWSDGEALDTDDIDFTFSVILTTDTLVSPNAVNLRSQVERVTVIDDRTFKVYLRKSNMRFPHELLSARREGIFIILPKHVWENNFLLWQASIKTPGFFDPFIGSGPYVLNAASDDELVLERNPDWWGAKAGFADLPEPSKVLIHYYESNDDAIEALKGDKLDVGPEVSYSEFETITGQNPNVITWSDATPIPWPGYCPRQLDFNTKVAPWSDARLRRAVSHFIDRQQIVDNVYDGENRPSRTMFPELSALKPVIEAIENANLAHSPTADIAAGDAALVALGFAKGADGIYEKGGVDLALTIHVSNASPEYLETAEAIRDMLIDAGVAATLIELDDGELWGVVLPRGEFQAAYGWLSCGSVVDPYASLRRYHPQFAVPIGQRSPGFQNMARWDSQKAKQYGQIVDKIGALEPGSAEIITLSIEAYELLRQETPFVPLVQSARIIPFNTSRWTGWPVASNPYAMPILHWGQFHPIVHALEPAN